MKIRGPWWGFRNRYVAPWIVLIGGSSTRTGRLSGRVKLNLTKRWPAAVIVVVFVAGKFERSNLNSCWDCHEIFEQLWFVWEVAAGVGLLLGTMAEPGIHFWLEKIELLNSIFKKCILNLHIFYGMLFRLEQFLHGTHESCFHTQIMQESTASVTKPVWKTTISIWEHNENSFCNVPVLNKALWEKFAQANTVFFWGCDGFDLGWSCTCTTDSLSIQSVNLLVHPSTNYTVYAKSLPHFVQVKRQLFFLIALSCWGKQSTTNNQEKLSWRSSLAPDRNDGRR